MKTQATEQTIIVLVKVEMTGLEPTGRNVLRDMNWYPEFRPAAEAKAVIWLNRGTVADITKAQAFADQEGYTVMTFPTTEKNPIGRAKAAMLAALV